MNNNVNIQHNETIFYKAMIDAVSCPVFISTQECIINYNISFENNFQNIDINNIDFTKENTTFNDKINQTHTFKILQTNLSIDGKTLYILKDITKEIELEKMMNTFLHIDSLTELPNRPKLIKDLRILNITSLAILDLKDFKEINDFYGNKVGDFILKSVAEYIITMLNEGQILYKFHADTYCIANLTLNQEEFTKLISNIVEKIDEKVFLYDQYEIDTRIIAGISFSSKNNKLITADLALQAAKKNNKSYIVFYDELDNLQEYQNNLTWTKKLKTAIAEDKIVVYFQPLVDNKTLKVAKYECLVRMIDDNRIISPFFFLEVAKKQTNTQRSPRLLFKKHLKHLSTYLLTFPSIYHMMILSKKGLLSLLNKLY